MQARSNPRDRQGVSAYALAAMSLLAVYAAEVAAILRMNSGQLTFTLDDPYIHLALAEQLGRGNYALSAFERSTPSSSVLWPFLLVPFARLAAAPWVILAANVGLSLATVWVFDGVLARTLRGPGPARSSAWWALTLLLFAAGTNLVGLPFTGMEHSLQVFLAVVIAAGMATFVAEDRVPASLAVAVVLAPLVRYESLAVSAAALLLLALLGRLRAAIGLGLAMAAPLAAFSAFLLSRGFSYLPDSVRAKLPGGGVGHWLHVLGATARANFASERGVLLAACAVALLGCALALRGRRLRAFAVVAALATLLHLCAGQFGWGDRYEIYIWAFVEVALVAALPALLSPTLPAPAHPARVAAFAGAWVALLASRYVVGAYLVPFAASNVYEQQGQLRRFAREHYRKAVAVNDVGLVAWGSPLPVLDLWGLGCSEALALRSRGEPAWFDGLMARRGIKLAMIFDSWFAGAIPAGWRKLGKLELGRRQVYVAQPAVDFYVTDVAELGPARDALEGFVRSLPPGVRFVTAGP